ncbi:glutathione S-transferase N-terminal domain-containing protein [Candidatus Kaiserbacteria bacterium]|nr:glutathione S-transferase N-terminal domain-containing protein [Candidatus Kaiserbacteria bacterium]
MEQEKVTIFTTPTCPYCKQVKEFFAENNISYEEKDVAKDAAARAEMIEKSQQMGVPVILLGQEVVVGFNKVALQKWLDIHAK